MNKTIKFLDLKKNYLASKEEIDGSIMEVINTTNFIHGSSVTILKTILHNFLI
jgi:hypothetical protein